MEWYEFGLWSVELLVERRSRAKGVQEALANENDRG